MALAIMAGMAAIGIIMILAGVLRDFAPLTGIGLMFTLVASTIVA